MDTGVRVGRRGAFMIVSASTLAVISLAALSRPVAASPTPEFAVTVIETSVAGVHGAGVHTSAAHDGADGHKRTVAPDDPKPRNGPLEGGDFDWLSDDRIADIVTSILIALLVPSGGLVVTTLSRPIWRRKFWHIEPLLRCQALGAPNAVIAKGRVPLVVATDGSPVSILANLGKRMFLRPSSPKPAFVVLHCLTMPEVPGQQTVDGLPAHGFELDIALHPHEHAAHFRRSLGKTRDLNGRTIAICDPCDLAQPDAEIQCRLVKTAKNEITTTENPRGDNISLVSADPGNRKTGNRWTERVAKVPKDAFWLVIAPPGSERLDPETVELEERDVRKSRKKFVRSIHGFIAIMLLVAIVVTIGPPLGASFLGLSNEGLQDELSLSFLLWFAAFAVFGLFVTIASYLGIAAGHLLGHLSHEIDVPVRWRGGTTACIYDAELIRNGYSELIRTRPQAPADSGKTR